MFSHAQESTGHKLMMSRGVRSRSTSLYPEGCFCVRQFTNNKEILFLMTVVNWLQLTSPSLSTFAFVMF